MKKFKNKTTGIVGELKEDGHLHFTRGDGNIACHETIWFGFVENSCDWEKVVEKDYEILSINTNSYFGVSTSPLDIDAFENGRCKDKRYSINSVIRLKDSVIFKEGVLTNAGKIIAFELHGEKLMVRTDGGLTNFDNSLCLRKKAILTTFDDVELFEGDEYYTVYTMEDSRYNTWVTQDKPFIIDGNKEDYVHKDVKYFADKNKAEEYIRAFRNYKTVDGKQIKEGDVFYCYDNKRFKCIETRFRNFMSSKWDGKRYRTKEEVEELILFNKPCLSLNNLLSVWGCDTEAYKTSPLFLKFKEFAEKERK